MRAIEELERLKAKIDSGDMHPDEPLFCLRAQDKLATAMVRIWVIVARQLGTPKRKLEEAERLANRMSEWPIKQVPGLPDTRNTCGKDSP